MNNVDLNVFPCISLSFPGQGRGSAAGLSGAGGCVGESGGPVSFLWDRGPDRQTLLQHEGLPPHLLELPPSPRSPRSWWASVAKATVTSCPPRPLVTALSGFGVWPISQLGFVLSSSVAIALLLSSGPPAALVYPTSSKRLLMHGVLDYVREYSGPSLSLFISFSPPTALCAKTPVGQQRETSACLP